MPITHQLHCVIDFIELLRGAWYRIGHLWHAISQLQSLSAVTNVFVQVYKIFLYIIGWYGCKMYIVSMHILHWLLLFALFLLQYIFLAKVYIMLLIKWKQRVKLIHGW